METLWARMCIGVLEDGSSIEPNDPFWDELVLLFAAVKERLQAWLEQRHIYGDLGNDLRFAGAFEKWLTYIWDHETEGALKAYTSGVWAIPWCESTNR